MLQLFTTSDRGTRRLGIVRTAARWLRWHLPRRIGAHRILSGPLRGQKIVTSWRDYPAAIAGITEPQLLGWFAQEVKRGETWLDIGAHYGYTSIALGNLVGSQGRVFAFEPMAATVGCLARSRALNKLDCITIIPMALGSDETMHLEQLDTVRGMVDSTVHGAQSISKDEIWKEKIVVAQMDWLWPRISTGDEIIHGIKIDVQGMELHVLNGMKEVLRKQRPKLVIELHRGVERAAVLKLLVDAGYNTTAVPIEPVPGEVASQFIDDRSYAFFPAAIS